MNTDGGKVVEVEAARVQNGLFSWTKLFFPDRILFDGERVTVIRKFWFGMGRNEDELPITRIASVRISSGIFNSTITVQTNVRAEQDLVVSKLPKKPAESLVNILRDALAK